MSVKQGNYYFSYSYFMFHKYHIMVNLSHWNYKSKIFLQFNFFFLLYQTFCCFGDPTRLSLYYDGSQIWDVNQSQICDPLLKGKMIAHLIDIPNLIFVVQLVVDFIMYKIILMHESQIQDWLTSQIWVHRSKGL